MLTTDYDLKQSELQQIASADALAGLFTALGYDTSQMVVQVPDAMGFPEALAREVVHMERIATHDENALQVYLVELKHVTVALTQAIARVLKSRAGLFLFALTTRDYEDIDFVLFESLVPEHSKRNKLSSPQVVIRPRILSVDRRNTDSVSLRVLRRFSYTEIDAYYQWDKLRSAYSVAEWSEPLFNNRALFSDYYLLDRLPQRDEWKEEPRSSYQAINKLLVDVREKFSRADEAKVRTELVEPVFKVLGWNYEIVKDAKDDSEKPDYILITTTGNRIPCLAYRWDRFLDGRDENRDEQTPDENPAQRVVSIFEKPEYTAKWAIVTNGKTWRLYAAQGQVNSYYEMDLEETLASPDRGDAFRYFWHLFRAKAFSDEPSFVDFLLTESASYAKGLGEKLKENVFDKVFPQFAEGFVKAYGKPGAQLTDDELNETFHATLTFLYRLLFLLYAEARDLLPVKETRGYWETSLTRMKKEIAAKAGEIDDLAYEKIKKSYSASETGLYDRLSELFAVIDKGKAELNVPVYNGGLFITSEKSLKVSETFRDSPEIETARFLSSHKIPDRYLAFGLDLLARDIDDKTQALVMIDYKSLGVRQLGSIYEGLLEFKLRVAREKMAVVAGKKGDAIIPYAEAEKLGSKIRMVGRGSAREEFIYKKGEVYLDNDRHERKASGSFFTPEYTVKHIVQNTVGPALAARFEELRPKLREAEQAYHAARKRQEGFEKMGQKGDDPEKTAYAYRHLVNELFDMRVLDPAMGSGHFLVETVDFITRRLLDFLNAFPWNPVRAALRGTRESILDEMQKQGVSIDPARLTDINLLKRFVLKRCIYGVDLNPMAVELAKVSLWLDCFTLGAPLSFLDHHLRCGNSLIGTNVKTVEESIRVTKEGQLSLYAGPFAGLLDLTSLMVEVVERSDATVADVHSSAEGFGQFRKMLEPYKEVLDLWTSQYFDNPRAKEFVTLFGDQVMPALKGEMKIAKEYKEAIANSRVSAKEKRFFHWDLEFPEIFVDLYKRDWKENPGFDAVVGNPPYIRVRTLKEFGDTSVNYYEGGNFECAVHVWDIYLLFSEQAQRLAKQDGFCSFIMPIQTLHQPNCESLRSLLLANCAIKKIIDLSNLDVFEEAIVKTCILVFSPSKHSVSSKVQVSVPLSDKLGLAEMFIVDQSQLLQNPNHSFKPDILINAGVLKKIESVSEPLQDLYYVTFGLRSGAPGKGQGGKERLILDEASTKRAKPYMEGREIGRFETDWAQRFIDYIPDKMYSPRSPSLFETPKIISQSMLSQKRLVATLDLENKYVEQSLVCIIPYSKENSKKTPNELSLGYILSLINSQLSSFCFAKKIIGDSLGGGLIHATPGSQAMLPIRHIDFKTSTDKRKSCSKEFQSMAQSKNTSKMLSFVDVHLGTVPEESDIVHDLLAYLAEQMIDLNKQKQSEMKHFLGWLEGMLKVGVDEMTGKSKLRNYIGNYQKSESEVSQAELEDIFYKNRNKLGISLSDARPMAKIRDEYEKSLAVLRPLKERLRWTDGLIDQIVYRLYGLSPDEIRIVGNKT